MQMARRVSVTIPYTPRPLQKEIHETLSRFNVLVCHRRFGKTVLVINQIIKDAMNNKKKNPRYAYIAPLYRQAKQVAWDFLKEYTQNIPMRMVNESELRVDLPNGARIQLFGADNPDSMRGIYLDGACLDEYAQMSQRMWSEVVRPALSDRKGWAIFIGTPQGHNQFYELYMGAKDQQNWTTRRYKASETGVIEAAELEAAKHDMSEAEYDQEFECSWQAAIRGAYYGKIITSIEERGQIANVPHDPAHQVETWWDLGVGDSTVIWFVQRIGQEIHVIDHYEMTGEGLPHYAKVLQDRGYIYSQHVAPHDIEVRELGSGKSRREIARSLGIDFAVAPKQSVEDGISAVRAMLPRCWFDKTKCKQGLEALRQYRSDYDDRLRVFRPRPLHDWTSHSADAFRYGAVAKQPEEVNIDLPIPTSNSWMAA